MRRRTQADRPSAAATSATRALRSIPRSLLIANAVLLTIVIDALLWYRWATNPTQNAGWLFAAGVLALLVLTLLLNLHRLEPPRARRANTTPRRHQPASREVATPPPLPPTPSPPPSP